MSFLLWQQGAQAIASQRRVLRAAEVPLCQDALALQQRLAALLQAEQQRLAEAERAAAAKGLAQGLAEGRAQAQAELASRLRQLGEQAQAECTRLHDELVPLALQVVHKLLGNFEPDVVLAGLARSALAEVLPAQPVTLWLHPTEADAVRERLAGQWPGEVRADPDAAPGTCRLETPLGSVDAALHTQLAQIERLAAAALA